MAELLLLFFWLLAIGALALFFNFKRKAGIKDRRDPKIIEWKRDYSTGVVPDCPHCSAEDQEHRCRECHSDIEKRICWDNEGYCKACLHDIRVKIPKIIAEKLSLGIKCQCVVESCAKCLGTNCADDNCITHTLERKQTFMKKSR